MSIFLHLVSVPAAVQEARRIAVPCGAESVDLAGALQRVLAEDVRADVDIPGFTRSVVDGYAVRAADTTGAGEAIPSILAFRGSVPMGGAPPAAVGAGGCLYVPTGGVLPEGADAVVMIEHAERIGGEVLVRRAVALGENVLFSNEDFAQGEIVCTAGRRLSSRDIGVLAAAGCMRVEVRRIPKVGVISTGNELVPIATRPLPGQVRDVNSFMAGSFVREQGCTPVLYGIVRDDRTALRSAISHASGECDAVLVSGGSSKDDRDMVASVIGELGEVLVHGIAISPGKPTIIGKVGDTPVVGLPGHPASSYIVLIAIVRHLLAALSGWSGESLRIQEAVLGQNIPSARGREEYVRVTVRDGVALPVFGKSGLLNTLVRSTGVVRIPAGREGLESGEHVEVIVW